MEGSIKSIEEEKREKCYDINPYVPNYRINI